ncbi:DNA alkylation repair protein [Candidatus Nomurabacteria bacterium]|nr:DNA alkylation repair protein [Candidatus Nomurabacteria bacterium]
MKTIAQVRSQLRSLSSTHKQNRQQIFSKDPIKSFGVAVPQVRTIAKESFAHIKHLSKSEIFSICETLADGGRQEEILISFDWALRLKKEYEPSDISRFEKWLKKYVSNWALCDDLCTRNIGYLIFRFPEVIPKVVQWSQGKNKWLRRASAVSFIYAARRGQAFDDIILVSNALLSDSEDMVQKGYGWALKEASKCFAEEVYDYLAIHTQDMPRTAFRYALEKLPQNWKSELMNA